MQQSSAPSVISQTEEFQKSLARQQTQFQSILPPQIKVEKFCRVLMTAVSITPALLNANRTSLFNACLQAAKDGLLPDGKEAALVPFGDKVTYMPMITGILKKIRNSGELHAINTFEINKNDSFEYYIDENGPHLKHVPSFANPGEFVGAYTLAKMKDGGLYLEVMSKDQIDSIKNRSRSANAGPWKTDYSEMAKKTVTRRLSKRLPSSTDIEGYFGDDDFEPINETTPHVSMNTQAEQAAPVASMSTPQPGPSKLKNAIAAKSKPVEQPEFIADDYDKKEREAIQSADSDIPI